MTSMEHMLNGNHFFTLLALVLAVVALVLATTHDNDDHIEPMFSKTITLALGNTTDTGISIPYNFIATGFTLKTTAATTAGGATLSNIGTTTDPASINNTSNHDITTVSTTPTFYQASPGPVDGNSVAQNSHRMQFTHSDLAGQTAATVEFVLYGFTLD